MARTEDARTDQGLQLSSEESRAIIDSIAQPLFAIDRQFRLVTCNRSGEAHIRALIAARTHKFKSRAGDVGPPPGPPPADAVDDNSLSGFCYSLLYGRDSVCPYCPAFNDAERVFLHDRPVEKMIQLRDDRGEEINYRLTFSRADSQRIMMLETLEDVTDQNQIQEEALRKENLAALGIMISGIAHELNNPLTGMGLNLQNLQANLETMAPEEILKRLGILKKDLHQAARIVSDILSFSRPGQLRLTKADILQTVEKAVATTKRLYPVLSRQTDFRIEGENIIFPFDPEKIERLFINLLRNSIQAFDYARGYIRVDVRLTRRSAHVIIEDNAGGIPPENLKNIFKPFFTSSQDTRGSGLGLTICHSIVREHDGRIHVRSQNGKTRFYISLPLKPAQVSA
ncbi:MAG: ATP-binding protein [bacterium]|nr:ATP-binding protein [bacterium]